MISPLSTKFYSIPLGSEVTQVTFSLKSKPGAQNLQCDHR